MIPKSNHRVGMNGVLPYDNQTAYRCIDVNSCFGSKAEVQLHLKRSFMKAAVNFRYQECLRQQTAKRRRSANVNF
jgi:hypothetical protein